MKTKLLTIIGIAIMLIAVSILILAVTSDDMQKIELSGEKPLLELYKDKPEVIAFYAKYNDAQASIRDDHISYFAGNGDDFRVRMNLYFDENYELDHMEFNCYVDKVPQVEVAEHYILKYLEKNDCKKYGT